MIIEHQSNLAAFAGGHQVISFFGPSWQQRVAVFVEELDTLQNTFFTCVIHRGPPVLFWTMDEASGDLFDYSHRTHTGTAAGTPTYGEPTLTGDGRTSMAFDGTDDVISAADHADLDFAADFSISVLFACTSLQAGGPLVSKGEVRVSGTPPPSWHLSYDQATDTVTAYTYSAAVVTAEYASGGLDDGLVHHVVMVREDGYLYLYVDGVLRDTSTTADTATVASAFGFLAGSKALSTGGPDFFEGTLAMVSAHGYAITAPRVALMFDDLTHPLTETALMQARSGIARAGATRSDYYFPNVAITIAGTDVASRVVKSSMEVSLNINERPCTATMMVRNFIPQVGNEVIVGFGEIGNAIFGGTIINRRDVRRREGQTVPRWEIGCTDYQWLLDREKVRKRYTSTSASVIAADIVDSFSSGFSTNNIVSALDSVDEIEFTSKYPRQALTALANRGGYLWYVDPNRDIHFFDTEISQAPDAIDSLNREYWGFAHDEDLTQIINQVQFEGGGSVVTAEVLIGASTIPVSDTVWYNDAGGTIVSGPQIITYTGRSTTSNAGNLTGVSGVLYRIPVDQEVNLWVVRNDTASQTTMAALEGGDGIHAASYQDRRLSEAGAIERADQELALRATTIQVAKYFTRSKFATPGKEQTINLPGILVSNHKIQSVVLTDWQRGPTIWPRRDVTCSNRREPADLIEILADAGEAVSVG